MPSVTSGFRKTAKQDRIRQVKTVTAAPTAEDLTLEEELCPECGGTGYSAGARLVLTAMKDVIDAAVWTHWESTSSGFPVDDINFGFYGEYTDLLSDAAPFIIELLHDLGHCTTDKHDLYEDEYGQCSIVRKILESKIIEAFISSGFITAGWQICGRCRGSGYR